MNLIVPFAGSLLLHLVNVLDNNCLRYHIITGLILHSFDKLISQPISETEIEPSESLVKDLESILLLST